MRALELQNKKLSFTQSYPIPVRQKNEALIKVIMTGICRTDIELCKGYMDFSGVPGHEFVGIVVEADDSQWIGKKVVGDINISCGSCFYCRRMLHKHCTTRRVLGISKKDGSFAEYLTLPLDNLHSIPDTVNNEAALFVEPLAAAFQVLEDCHIPPSAPVLIIGDGKLGLLIAMVLLSCGYEIVLLGHHPVKWHSFPLLFHATVWSTYDNSSQFPIVIEASGSPAGLQTALQAVQHKGTIVLKSTFAANQAPPLFPIVVNEVKIIGSRCGLLPVAIRALERKLLDPTVLLEHLLPFDRWEGAFQLALTPGTLKVAFLMEA